MTSPREHEALAAIERFCGVTCMAFCLVLLYGMSQRLDAMDRKAAEQHAARQAQAQTAAQPDRWAELDEKAKHMVAYDQINQERGTK